jgi:hypothetical protein
MSDVKTNFKGKYETFECDICREDDENQEHLMKCKELNKMKENNEKMPVYEKLFESDVKNLKEIAKCFIENIKIRQKLIKEKSK